MGNFVVIRNDVYDYLNEVNLAARLESAADANGCFIDEFNPETILHVQDWWNFYKIKRSYSDEGD